jgi:hypothetical protein
MSRNKACASEAAKAHTNLNTFESVIALLEGGTIYTVGGQSAYRTVTKIIKLCKDEQQRQLSIYDSAMSAIVEDAQ